MEPHSLNDEGPRLRPEERSAFPWIAAALALGVAGGIAYFYFQPGRAVPPAPIAKTETAPAPQPAEPAIRNPLPEAPAKSLPTLDNSDSMMRESLAALLGRQAFAEYFIPARLVRNIVATVDNLPRRAAPRRVMPLNAVPGAFATTGAGETLALDTANAARYAAHVRALAAVPARALVELYVETYPLFQRAYEELGYPGKYFNDRLLETIDDLLAAPEVEGPVALARPRVLYEFADPQLEARSAGQKILVRMGTGNARQVKAKLREIRQEIAAAATRKP
jgi:hypothetical protein